MPARSTAAAAVGQGSMTRRLDASSLRPDQLNARPATDDAPASAGRPRRSFPAEVWKLAAPVSVGAFFQMAVGLGEVAIGAVGLSLGLGLAAPAALFAAGILASLGSDGEVVAAGAPYFAVSARGLAPTLPRAVATSVLGALGRSLIPMLATIPFLAMDTALGAGLATVLAQKGRPAVLPACLRKEGALLAGPVRWAEMPRHLKRLLAIAVPLSLPEFSRAVGLLAHDTLLARAGAEGLAGSQIAGAIGNVFTVLFSGLPVAAMILVGRQLGVGDPDRARASATRLMRLGALRSFAGGALLAGTTFGLEALYPSISPEVLTVAAGRLALAAVLQPVKLLDMVIGNGVLPSGGDARYILIVDLVSSVPLGLPAAVLLGFGIGCGPIGIFGGKVVEEASRLAMLHGRSARGNRSRTLQGDPRAVCVNSDIFFILKVFGLFWRLGELFDLDQRGPPHRGYDGQDFDRERKTNIRGSDCSSGRHRWQRRGNILPRTAASRSRARNAPACRVRRRR